MILVAFALLGIGNTILQVSLNPLLTNVVRGDRLTSSLTWGQFIKAIASFLGPIIAGFAAASLGKLETSFPYLCFYYFTFQFMVILYNHSGRTHIRKKHHHFLNALKLLGDKTILLLFFGIFLVVGVDVGLNTTIPKFLMERCAIPLEQAGLGTSLYFVARTVGAFVGAILLVKTIGT